VIALQGQEPIQREAPETRSSWVGSGYTFQNETKMAQANTIAYFARVLVSKKKSFTALTPGVNVINIFFLCC
jgi:hypothetical protein